MSNILKIAASGVEAAPTEYQIERSLRFNSADSAYLSRTPASAGNRKTWTWSGWVKFSIPSSSWYPLFGAMASTAYIELSTDYKITFRFSSGDSVRTDMVFRDPSAWYHLVFVADTTQATDTNRLKAYVNGVQVSLTPNLTWPSLNEDGGINTTVSHTIGADVGNSTYQNGYMAEVHFIDGQALTPSDFGETDATTGVWKPKAYAGTYGTNGFYLDFSDNSSTTTLGYDAAGSNDWTPNNFSVTAGAGNDSLVDTPTPYGTDTGVGGEVRGNYCTLNPLTSTLGGGSGTASNGNLAWIGTGGNDNIAGTMSASSGKFYYEVTIVAQPTRVVAGWSTTEAATHYTTSALFFYESAGIRSGTKTSVWNVDVTTGLTFAINDVIGFAIDIDGGELKVYQNNSLVSTITLPTDKGDEWIPCIGDSSDSDGSVIVNFGQRPFAYTAPSGFKALCTQNLPTPTVVQGGDYFNSVLYTGNGSTQSITGVGFQPDWVWIKGRSLVSDNRLHDAVRGAEQTLTANSTAAESVDSGVRLTSLDSDGFSVGSSTFYNNNTSTFVAWNWNAGGSNATNTDGTITSTVRANTTAGFSIVSYTGNGATATVGHGLGVAPKWIIAKARSSAVLWPVYTETTGKDSYMVLSATSASTANAGYWGAASPTSSVFGVGNFGGINGSGTTYIAYCFAEVPGYSAFGSYTGNGSADGPFVYTGFRPAFVMRKRTDTTGSWIIQDDKRIGYNAAPTYSSVLYANETVVETIYNEIDILSNGFKCRATESFGNASGGTYLWFALAENPFKYSLAR